MADKDAKKRRNAAYYAANRERLSQAHLAYYEQNRVAMLQQQADYYEANKELIQEKRAAWYRRNAEQLRVRRAAWYQAHPGASRNGSPETRRAAESRRRARAVGLMSVAERRESAEWRRIIKDDPCFYCGGPGEQDEHYVSLANGGTDHWWNIVRSCAFCNNSKGTMNGDEFLALTRRAG